MPRPFLIYSSIISIPTHLTDNFSDFISIANSMTYAENRQPRGLTRFGRIEKQATKLRRRGRPAWADANVIDAIGWF